ncbi:phage tail spike protein [Jeotgalibaca porci]|uniref:phage tail spike protein n=3 Tax=Jeotgalibaca porci TaxID=1868793 RepID=UPI0035A0E4CD
MKPRIYAPMEKDFSHNGLGVLSDATRCDVTEQANGIYEIELEHPLLTRFDQYFENGYQIKAKPNDQEEYHIFEIKQTYKDTINNNVLIYAQSRTYKLGNRQVQHVEINQKNGSSAMQLITAGMDSPSDIQLFSDIITTSSTTFEARNVLNCIAGEQGSLLQYWGGEIKREPFKLSLLRRRGRDNVGTVRYGKDLDGLKIKFDWLSIVTRCLPYADLQDGNDGQTKRIYGNKVDSELISKYPDIYSRHIQFTEEQGVKDLASLDRVAANYFTSINPGSDKPKISIELEIMKLTDSEEAKEFARLRNYGLFDTFSVYHSLYDIYIDTKITEVVYDSLTEKNKRIVAGDARMSFYKQQDNEFQNVLKTLTKKDYMSQFVDYITDLINGVEGGAVLQYPKNKPHTTYYMDTESRETAKDVIAINNQGIGFSRTGWRGPFVNAWSIDGVLNADFILAGVLRAIDIIGVNIYGSKISGAEIIGSVLKSIGPYGNQVVIDGGGYAFEDTQTGQVIAKLHNNGDVLTLERVLNNSGFNDLLSFSDDLALLMHQNLFEISAPITRMQKLEAQSAVIDGRLDVDSIYINGVQLIPGQGGGGGDWNGTYPPGVTSSADKFAWQAWAILIGKGYSKQAAAGILGNIQGEVGPAMNPDMSQVGGPAYGAVQWDGSAYPLVGSPTWDGREYVQRLMGAAGITKDYTTMSAQMDLLDWCMYNGQWIGAVNPTTVAGFKAISDVAQAAHAFERNFERPAVAHPEREGWAVDWYNKFKDLEISTGGAWRAPIDNPITITSEFGWRDSPINPGTQELHNGIDLVGGTGATTNIYASGAGTVVFAGWENSYGNYVIIQHTNGLYTGYAHNSSLSVANGDVVVQGQKIANMGSTGESTGAHTHFQFFRNGPWPSSSSDFINPREYINF